MKNTVFFSFFLSLVSCICFAEETAVSGRAAAVRSGSGRVAIVAAPTNAIRHSGIQDKKIEDKKNQENQEDENCRDSYRNCMDEFCLFDAGEGGRCACSDNIKSAKPIIDEIVQLGKDTDALFTSGVEREEYGVRAAYIFGDSERARSKRNNIDFTAWVYGDTSGGLATDNQIGLPLYSMASEFCADKLKKCGKDADMEEQLYSRLITNDCKTYNTHLESQKRDAIANKALGEKAVRTARAKMMDTTNALNRGQCLIAFRNCVSSQGGCGVGFENCLDKKLLGRRANACENILDTCDAVRKDVLDDWDAEVRMILADATKNADRNFRQTCLAQSKNCLEESCSISTNSDCLSNIKTASGFCPIINECNVKIPGFANIIADQLAFIRVGFCQNDVNACLRRECGADFTNPKCAGKNPSDIITLCPQEMFPSCKTETFYDVIVQSAFLDMNYELVVGCTNKFAEKLGATCGLDMACLGDDVVIENLTTLPDTSTERNRLYFDAMERVSGRVDAFFAELNKDIDIAECKNAVRGGGETLGESVMATAKLAARTAAEARTARQFNTKIATLVGAADVNAAEELCYDLYSVQDRPSDGLKAFSYISSVNFEPSLMSCHVCRTQKTTEEGGEKKATSALKAGAGGLAAGTAMGTAVSPGWGSVIGAAVGLVGGGVMGALSGGIDLFPNEIVSCEDINMSGSGTRRPSSNSGTSSANTIPGYAGQTGGTTYGPRPTR